MIWYFLYPIRGTTEPPILDSTHPIRRVFISYAKWVSTHALATLLISALVATALVFPFPFLYTSDFASGTFCLSHNGWADAEPLPAGSAITPDVAIRAVWVHGSYMNALDKDILVGALGIQEELLGSAENFNPQQIQALSSSPHILPTTGRTLGPRNAHYVSNRLNNQSWFFYSPLQYWNGSRDNILADNDVVATINEWKIQPTMTNVTLRPSLVFSGNKYRNHQLVAVDTLVITLVHHLESSVGRQWERRASELATDPEIAKIWNVYHPEEKSILYNFRFSPMSIEDLVMLATAYTFIICYLLWTLSKTRAVKSRMGLIVSILVQIGFSVMSSCTICAFLDINLSGVPYAAYPFIMLALGLEHIFRLINAVIATPPDKSTSVRVAEAYGKTTLDSFLSCLQNTMLLMFLSQLMRPVVASFCIFIAIAIPIDFFFLSTFFLAVLSIDVRRGELEDLISRTSTNKNKFVSKDIPRCESQTIGRSLRALFRSRVALTTRTGGTIVLLASIAVMQWHFLKIDILFEWWRVIMAMMRRADQHLQPGRTIFLNIHQERSPEPWLRFQNHKTVHQFIMTVKPKAHEYVAQVYDPLVFVFKGAERIPPSTSSSIKLPPAVINFVDQRLGSLLMALLLVALGMWYLVQHILLPNNQDIHDSIKATGDSPISVTTLAGNHALDVNRLGATNDGIILSFGLDRSIIQWNLQSGYKGRMIQNPADQMNVSFPVLGISFDKNSEWAAFLSSEFIQLWNMQFNFWGPRCAFDAMTSRPELLFFSQGSSSSEKDSQLVVMHQDGVLSEIDFKDSTRTSHDMEIPAISLAQFLSDSDTIHKDANPLRIIATSRSHRIIVISSTSGPVHWLSTESKISEDVSQIIALPRLNSVLLVYKHHADLYDVNYLRIVHIFELGQIQRRSLKCISIPQRHEKAGASAIFGLILAYQRVGMNTLEIEIHTATDETEVLCYLNHNKECMWVGGIIKKKMVCNPGQWTSLECGAVVGVRRKINNDTAASSSLSTKLSSAASGSILNTSSNTLRNRGNSLALLAPSRQKIRERPKNKLGSAMSVDSWEVWSISHLAETEPQEHMALLSSEDDKHLFASRIGPMVNINAHSIALGLGNAVKIISIRSPKFGGFDQIRRTKRR